MAIVGGSDTWWDDGPSVIGWVVHTQWIQSGIYIDKQVFTKFQGILIFTSYLHLLFFVWIVLCLLLNTVLHYYLEKTKIENYKLNFI